MTSHCVEERKYNKNKRIACVIVLFRQLELGYSIVTLTRESTLGSKILEKKKCYNRVNMKISFGLKLHFVIFFFSELGMSLA